MEKDSNAQVSKLNGFKIFSQCHDLISYLIKFVYCAVSFLLELRLN